MKVLKFGGTSVGSAERIRKVAGIVTGKGKNIVVLSAMAGTTNTLVEISDYLYKKNVNGAHDIVNALELKYLETIGSLYDKESTKTAATAAIKERFDYLRSLAKANFTVLEEREILAQGEMMSTAMMHLYLQEQGVKSVLLPALEYMRTDSNGEPDTAFLKARLSEMLDEHRDAEIYITQGYICKNAYGETDNLQRGGSDYSASLIGAAVGAEEIEIWTDIDGMHNNDPRYVENTRPVERLNFEEAAELAYFGAKILHPTCVQPAKLNNIPVRLLSTLDPSAKGTLIDNMAADHTGITAIRVKSSRMLLAYGFMSKVFEIFEAHKTPIDMVTVSEVGVSVTVDNERNLESIIAELRKFGTVTIDSDMVIICVVGDLEWQNRGFEAKALAALKDIPVRMISYGGSNCNISFLIRKDDKVVALAKLSEELFN
jgi:aspartate kinase